MKYCFIITSTLSSGDSHYNTKERLRQTLKTIDNIKERVPNPYIILIDNSHMDVPAEYFEIIKSKVSRLIRYEHTVASLYYNLSLNKGLGELLLLERAIKEIKDLGIRPNRIFKMSGRYSLNDNFDIDYYEDAPRKFIGTIRTWVFFDNSNNIKNYRYSFETSLWSFPFEEIDNVKNILIIRAFEFLNKNVTDLENAFFTVIPKELIEEKTPIGITTNTGFNGEVNHY